MINPTKGIEMTAMAYVTQFNFKASKHYDSNFHIIPARLEKMYINKYAAKGYYIDKQSFKVVVLQ